MLQFAKAQKSCNQGSIGVNALIEMKSSTFGPDCEAMCKKLGAYPDCQCPGFDGEPATDGDTRACYTKYCQNAPCPTDAFVGCVKENTKSFLQWQKVLLQVDQKFSMTMRFVKAQKSCT